MVIPNYVLIDKIMADLQQLKKKSSEESDKAAIDKIMDMFKPNVGIDIKEF